MFLKDKNHVWVIFAFRLQLWVSDWMELKSHYHCGFISRPEQICPLCPGVNKWTEPLAMGWSCGDCTWIPVFIEHLLCRRHHLKFTCIYLFDPHNVLKRKHLISIIPILKMKKWSLRFGNLPKATQLVIRGAGLEPRQSGSSAHAL